MTTTLPIPTDDAVWIMGDLYCKTPEALQVVLDTLRATGYNIEDSRTESHAVRSGKTTAGQMEQNGWALWYARLDDIRRGKCKSCDSYISCGGIQMHGHQCEVCGEVTYYDIIEGSTVNFEFRDDGRRWDSTYLQMTVQRWDTDNGWLYLLRKFRSGTINIMGPEQSEAYLADNSDKWEAVEEDGQQLIRLRYPLRHSGDPADDETNVIDLRNVWGHYSNYETVRLWEGEEYPKYDYGTNVFPVPESISVYEAWHWAPLEPSPTLHERVISAVGHTSDAGYYCQDGRAAWSRKTYEGMGAFVRHFTTLDADEWDRQSPVFRLDGPGGIADVARFCHPDAVVENQPNIGNFFVGVSKLAAGRQLTHSEIDAMMEAIDRDPYTQAFIDDTV